MTNVSPIEEMMAQLREQIGNAEVKAAMDLIRMDDEHKERKDKRWRRMVDETRHVRAQYDALVKEMTSLKMAEAVIIFHGDVAGDFVK